jgi:anti-sigma regulatory factor (Ser/Thr protein kinase)
MVHKSNEIKFLDSFEADTSVVPKVINILLSDLKKMKFPTEEIYEIVLSMDEAITNAIQETIKKEGNLKAPKSDDKRKGITIRYTITNKGFDATIIDHGKGLDIKSQRILTPDKSSNNYYDQIISYVSEVERKKLKVRLNGKEITLKGIGAGLKIILAYMDSVTIDLIEKKRGIANSISNFTDGTILNLIRKRRYK